MIRLDATVAVPTWAIGAVGLLLILMGFAIVAAVTAWLRLALAADNAKRPPFATMARRSIAVPGREDLRR